MADPKKIDLLVIPDLFPKFEGDVQGIFVLDYLRSAASFCNITALVPRVQGLKKGVSEENLAGAKILRYSVSENKPSGFAKVLAYFKLFRGAIDEGQKLPADIIHAHGTIVSGTIAYFVSRKKKIPFIITEHVGPFASVSDSFWKRTWTRFVMHKADAVLCVSEHQKKEILSCGIQPKKITVTGNPVDTELFKPAAEKKDLSAAKTENKNFLFVGRLDNFKGALRCANAFSKINHKYTNWTFTIVGDGEDLDPLTEFIGKTPGMQNKILLKGTKNKKEIAEEMRAADFLLFPSRHESFGLVIAEALSAGLPVITSNLTAPQEFVGKESGILVSPDNIDEIKKSIEEMIEVHSSYDYALIRSKIVVSYSFENFGKKLRHIYASLIN